MLAEYYSNYHLFERNLHSHRMINLIQNHSQCYCSFYYNFFYHNLDKNRGKSNCCEHIDQGFVSLEPFSAVSGLEIFEKERREWIRTDDTQYMNEHDLILFCSETFQRLSDGKYRGTLHRVGKNDLSITNPSHKFFTSLASSPVWGSPQKYHIAQRQNPVY